MEDLPFTPIPDGDVYAPEERADLEIMRTDSEAFREWIQARRSRTAEWFVEPTHRVEVYDVPVPSRTP